MVNSNLQAFGLVNPFHESVEAISFDIWNTLIVRNPQYSARRDEYLMSQLLDSNYHTKYGLELAIVAARTGNLLVDTIQETTGQQIGPETRIQLILEQINTLLALDGGSQYVKSFDSIDLDKILKDLETIFLANLPMINNNKILQIINFYRSLIPVAFVSNTGLTSGAVMRKALPLIGLEADHYYFSDEIKFAKPRKEMFAGLLSLPNITDVKNIIHIGDSAIADVKGAMQVGITPIHLQTPRPGMAKSTDGVAWKSSDDSSLFMYDLSKLEDVIRISPKCYLQPDSKF